MVREQAATGSASWYVGHRRGGWVAVVLAGEPQVHRDARTNCGRDVPYVPTVEGWLYLACVTDVFARLVVGWSMATSRKTDIVVDAVAMAEARAADTFPSRRDPPLGQRRRA